CLYRGHVGLAIGGSAGRFSFRQGRFGVRGAGSRFPRSPAPRPAVGQRPATAWASFRSLRRRGPSGAGATPSVTTAGQESGGKRPRGGKLGRQSVAELGQPARLESAVFDGKFGPDGVALAGEFGRSSWAAH